MNTDASCGVDFGKLGRYSPRRFVPEGADLTRAETVAELYRTLLDQPIGSQEQFDNWMLDLSELSAALEQVGSILYVRMTCQTDDKERAEAYRHFMETVVPAVRPLEDKVTRKYLEQRERFAAEPKRYEVLDRNSRADVQVFRDQNVPLQTQVELLSQEFQTVAGAMTAEFEGQERTLQQIGKFLYETDRGLRERAWRTITDRRLRDRDKLEDLFDKMLALRHQIATNAGFANYRDYKFVAGHRFDYTPEDCKRYHETVARLVVPAYRRLLEERRNQMALDPLRPWDTSVDPKGRPPLAPFEKSEELVAGARRIFDRVDPHLGGQFRMMADLGLLDLESRKGKAPGGYQTTLDEARKPFIFMNAVGVHRDVETLLHEGGHSFHSLAAADEPLQSYRHAPLEFSEVASMGMELLAQPFLDAFYDEEGRKRVLFEQFEGIVYILPWVATVDAFQHWIYENPTHSRQERADKWVEVFDRFMGGVVDWTGLDEVKRYYWHRQLHIFEYPFYYIEYGIAQLGALQLWVRARQDRQAALADYRKALALGGSRPLPELFAAAGLNFDFSEQTIGPLVKEVEAELARL